MTMREKGFRRGYILLAIILSVFISYSNTLKVSFQWYDYPIIVNNERVKDLSVLLDNINGSRFFTFFTFFLNFKIAGLDVTPFHLTNIFIHIIFTTVLFFLLKEMLSLIFRDIYRESIDYISFFASLFFGLHPVNTMAVTYISQRFTTLASLFYFLSLYLYIKARLTSKNHYFLLSLLCTIISMKSKEFSFTISLMVILIEFTLFRGRRPLVYLILFIITMSIIPLSRIDAFLEPVDQTLSMKTRMTTMSRWVYFITEQNVLLTYIRLFFLPYGLRADYDYPVSESIFEPSTFLSFLANLTIVVIAILFIRKDYNYKLIGLGIVWFYIALSVESSFIPLLDLIFEHRLYPAMPGLVMVVTGIVMFIPINKYRKPIVVISSFFLFIFMILTLMRNNVWLTEESFWRDNYNKEPWKIRIAMNYANTIPPQEALKIYSRFLERYPDDVALLNGLASAIMQTKDAKGAEEILKRSLGIVETKEGLLLMRDIYLKNGEYDNARFYTERLIELEPGNSIHHYYLGLISEYQGDMKLAESSYKRAIELDPSNVDALNNLGNILAEKGLYHEAIELFRRAIRIRKDLPSLFINLGITYAQINDYDEALRNFDRAIIIDYRSVDAWYNKAIILYNGGLRDEAILAMKKAIEIDPSYMKAQEMLRLWQSH